jgi:hypothetical protein
MTMSVRGRRGVAMAGLAVVASGCDGAGDVECACADPSVVIEVPPDRARDLTLVQLSGRGCAEVTPVCLQSAGSGCAEIAFRGTAVGTCAVTALFASGPASFQAIVSFVRLPCCPGFYANPPSSGVLQVPDRTDDSGASE